MPSQEKTDNNSKKKLTPATIIGAISQAGKLIDSISEAKKISNARKEQAETHTGDASATEAPPDQE